MNIFESSESRRPGTFIGKKLEKDSRGGSRGGGDEEIFGVYEYRVFAIFPRHSALHILVATTLGGRKLHGEYKLGK